jgi:hypothetical protein
MCVGGPMDGQIISLPAGSRSVVVPTIKPIVFRQAIYESPDVPHDALVPLDEGCYRIVQLERAGNDGVTIKWNVLAYFGRSSQDRPKGFFL